MILLWHELDRKIVNFGNNSKRLSSVGKSYPKIKFSEMSLTDITNNKISNSKTE